MIALIIIIAVFTIISLIPISFGVLFRLNEGENDIEITLKYGFIQIRLPEKKEKPAKPDKPDKPKKQEQPQKKEKSGPDVGKLVSFAWDERAKIKRMIAALLGYVLKHMIKIKLLRIRLVMGFDDAMQTALIYGAANAFVFNTVGLMDRHMRLGKHSISLKPAFNEPHIFTEDEAIITTCIFNALALAVIALRYAVPIYLDFRRCVCKANSKKDIRREQKAEWRKNKNGKSDQRSDTNSDRLA